MTIVHGYCTQPDLASRFNATTAGNTAPMDDVITNASREVDAYCGRRFYADSTLSLRDVKLVSDDGLVAYCDDVADTSTAVVTTDLAGSGTYSRTLTVGVDFIWEPLNGVVGGIEGWPATRIRKFSTYGSVIFPTSGGHPRVRINAKWGWTAVPAPVKQATLILAAEIFKLQEAPFGVAGFSEFGAVRVQSLPQVARLLDPYVAVGSFGIA